MAYLGRRQPFRPHLAGPIVAPAPQPPVVTRPYIVSVRGGQVARLLKPRTAKPIVVAAPTFLVSSPFIVSAAKANPDRFRKSGGVKLARPLLAPPPPPLWTRPYIASLVKESRDRYQVLLHLRLAHAIINPFVPPPAVGGLIVAAQATPAGGIRAQALSNVIAAQVMVGGGLKAGALD